MPRGRSAPTSLAATPPLRLVAQVGEGASAWLYLTHDESVVAKLAKPDHAETLLSEAERALFLRCVSLPELLGVGRLPEGTPPVSSRGASGVYSLWRYLPGSDADQLDLDESAVLQIARDVGRALAALHDRGLAHGDVKPGNVRWDAGGGRAWLLDLGLVSPLSTQIPRGATPRYLDPKLSEGLPSDARARDLFALGLTLLELAHPEARNHSSPSSYAMERLRSATRGTLDAVIRDLLAPEVPRRPPARWIWREASRLLGEPDPALAPDPYLAESTYLWTRKHELLGAAVDPRVELEGPPKQWVTACLEISGAISRLKAAPRLAPATTRIDPLSKNGVREWLAQLVGMDAASFRLPQCTEAELAQRVVDHCESFPATLLGERELFGNSTPEAPPASLQALALCLDREPSLGSLLAGVKLVHDGGAEPELRVALAMALRRRGEHVSALSLLGDSDVQIYRAEYAETLRRMGDVRGSIAVARAALEGLVPSPPNQAAEDRLRGTLGRALLAHGDLELASEVLGSSPCGIRMLEARVLLGMQRAALGQGKLGDVEADLERVESIARGDEERARARGLRGYYEHRRGDVERAREAFESAVEHANRAGARSEEATYLTGVAATATDSGRLGQAIAAADRASLMFRHSFDLSRAARAQLNLGAAQLAAGAHAPASDAFEGAQDLARRSGDSACERAVALSLLELALCRADFSDPELAELGSELASALGRLADPSPSERLSLGALRLQVERVRRERRLAPLPGELSQGELPELEQLGRDTSLPISCRLEWWTARALTILSPDASPHVPGRADAVLSELVALAAEPAPLTSKGPALTAGAALAASLRDGDIARRLGKSAEQAGAHLLRWIPEEYVSLANELPWIRRLGSFFDLEGSGHDVLAGAQLLKLEQLVRGLGVRGNLRALLNQVLDALVLWTGVERGLLLLTAPGGKLQVRAARNLSREDLSADQRQLSMTLAKRAASARQPVVAVDALGELPELTESVHALNLRSVLAVPLIARGEVLGVVYLDDRDRRGAFGEAELAWVRLLGSVASIAIAEARDQLWLRRSARQAERAKRRLELALQVEHQELVLAKRQLGYRAHPEIVGESPAMLELLRVLDKVAETALPVLVLGESGTGKELIARAVHQASERQKRAFVAENCAAVPESLLESTLFGHVKGAFTGADKNRVGLFELADAGSLFLDEIGEMSLSMQAKLLRVLERGEVRPVGAASTRRVDVRIIAATHRDLRELVRVGSFREDLFYRLDGFSLKIPPLRERPGDIRLLCERFLSTSQASAPKLSAAALRILEEYPWPGNVRQLQNELMRACVLSDGVLRPEHFSQELRHQASEAEIGLDLKRALELLERRLVSEALDRTAGNQTRAAKLLGVSRYGLQKMLKRLEITN